MKLTSKRYASCALETCLRTDFGVTRERPEATLDVAGLRARRWPAREGYRNRAGEGVRKWGEMFSEMPEESRPLLADSPVSGTCLPLESEGRVKPISRHFPELAITIHVLSIRCTTLCHCKKTKSINAFFLPRIDLKHRPLEPVDSSHFRQSTCFFATFIAEPGPGATLHPAQIHSYGWSRMSSIRIMPVPPCTPMLICVTLCRFTPRALRLMLHWVQSSVVMASAAPSKVTLVPLLTWT